MEYIRFKLNRYNRNLVLFEGGLGSQIFAYLEFTYLKKHGVSVEINLDYFFEGGGIDKGLIDSKVS
jgi:hypothetical protein